MNSDLSFRQGIRDTLPTVFGYIGIGLTFGIIGHAAGLSLLIIFLLSSVVYAGSAQFIAVTMMTALNPIFSIILSVFLINSRMILMSIVMAPYFKKETVGKNILLGSFLTDESFALGMNKRNYTDNKLTFRWFTAANLLSYISWNLSSIAGSLLGRLIPNPMKFGLGFAVTAMFIGLLYLQMTADRSMKFILQLLMVLITFCLFILGLVFIPSSVLVLVVTVVACGLGVLVKHAFFSL